MGWSQLSSLVLTSPTEKDWARRKFCVFFSLPPGLVMMAGQWPAGMVSGNNTDMVVQPLISALFVLDVVLRAGGCVWRCVVGEACAHNMGGAGSCCDSVWRCVVGEACAHTMGGAGSCCDIGFPSEVSMGNRFITFFKRSFEPVWSYSRILVPLASRSK